MECRSPTDYIKIEGNPSRKLTVSVKPNLADNPLVVGPRYINNDLKCSWSNYLGFHSSGVLCMCYYILYETVKKLLFFSSVGFGKRHKNCKTY